MIFILLFLFLNSSWFPSQDTSNWLRSQRQTFLLRVSSLKKASVGLLNSGEGARSSQGRNGKNQCWKAIRAPTSYRIQEHSSSRWLLDHPQPLWARAGYQKLHSKAPSPPNWPLKIISSTDWAFPIRQALGFPCYFPDISLPSFKAGSIIFISQWGKWGIKKPKHLVQVPGLVSGKRGPEPGSLTPRLRFDLAVSLYLLGPG